MEAIKKIESALTKLVIQEPFFATLAFLFSIKEDKEIPTFCTDGKNLFFNPEFCAGLKMEEIKTVLAHEVLHCALGHLWRMPTGADHETWNEAADHETNWILEESNETSRNRGQAEPFPFPCKESICLGNEFKGQAAEKIYQTLSKRKKPQGGGGQQDQKNQNGKGGTQGKGNKPGNFGDFIPQIQKVKAEQLKEEWNRATIQAAKVAKDKGNLPAEIKRMIEEIINPKINWKQILRDFLRELAENDYNFAIPNVRYFETTDFYLPSLKSETAGNVVFAVDTSGSITGENLSEFIAEAQSCLDELSPKKLTVISCDARIHEIETYEPGEKIKSNWKGGGGTDFRPVFRHLENENPDVLIYLTDLMGDFPAEEPPYPVLWIHQPTGRQESAPFGNMIPIE